MTGRASKRNPVRVLELRSVFGTGGGPDKTILLGTERCDPLRFAIQVCYLRAEDDPAYRLHEKAAGRVDYVEIRERHSFDWRIWTELRRIVRAGRFDIVHAHDYKTDLLAWCLGKSGDVIALATAHGWAGDSWKDRVYYAADRRILVRLPRVIAVSTPIRDTLIRHGADPARVKLILNSIDPEVFRRRRGAEAAARERFGIAPEDISLGSVGRLESEKRFDLLIDAFAELRRNEPRAKLLIAGSGSLEERLRAQIDRLGLDGEVRLLGHVDDVPTLHHALDLYVQSSEREGTPNAVLEAMAFETPIVATAVGGTEDLVRDGVHALLVPPHDATLLARAIRRAIRDPEERHKRAAAARLRIERELSFDARMQAVEAVYEELIADREEALRRTTAARECES